MLSDYRPSQFKAVIFDMDGVLIDAKDWHKDALNSALENIGVSIAEDEHLELFDGLPTKIKLQMLTEQGRIPAKIHPLLSNLKQRETLRIAALKLHPNIAHLETMRWLKSNNFLIGVATNSVQSTAHLFLELSGLMRYLSAVVTNEDVAKPKPDPQIYLRCMDLLGTSPEQTLVFEDNEYGLQAARDAGCTVFKINNVDEIRPEFVKKVLYAGA